MLEVNRPFLFGARLPLDHFAIRHIWYLKLVFSRPIVISPIGRRTPAQRKSLVWKGTLRWGSGAKAGAPPQQPTCCLMDHSLVMRHVCCVSTTYLGHRIHQRSPGGSSVFSGRARRID